MPARAAQDEQHDPVTRPQLGLATATFIVISSMVGTGVLTTSGFTVYAVGSNQLMLLLWVVGGIVAVCGALSVAELSAALPRSGGDYVFLYEAYGPLAAFLSGWVSFLLGFGGPIAATAFAAAKYGLAPLRLSAESAAFAQPAVASIAIVVLAAVHISGGGRTIKVQGGMTLLKLGILSLLAAAGIARGWGAWANLDDRPAVSAETVRNMISSLVYISYAYTGWNAASYLAGEIDRPRERLPRAILLGAGFVIVLYLALNVSFALALPASEVQRLVDDPANTQGRGAVAPIAQIAALCLYGPAVADPLSVAIGLTLLASLSAYVLTGPRVAYAMACAGQFPAAAARLSPRFGTPAFATCMQAGWALLLVWTSSFEPILLYSAVGLAIFSMLAVSAVFVLRWRRPDLERPFRTPGYPVVPAVFLVATALLVATTFQERPVVSAFSVASILAGIPFYLLWGFFRAHTLQSKSPDETPPSAAS